MSKRTSKVFGKIEALTKPINLVVKTKCPQKWILIDTETAGVYQGKNNLVPPLEYQWLKLERKSIKTIVKMLENKVNELKQ